MNDMERLTVSMDGKTMATLVKISKFMNRTRSGAIRQLITEYELNER